MPQPTFETLDYDLEDGVAVITLDRPDKLNAFNTQMMRNMLAVFNVTAADDAVKCVIVTGAGQHAFFAGADLSTGGDTFDYEGRGGDDMFARREKDVHRDGGGLTTLRIFENLKPLIGAANGVGVGVGATMQLAMYIRLASTDASYGFVFARRGINLEACSSWFLPRLVGMQTALEWCYSGRIFPAEEARWTGVWVRSLHAPDDLLPAAKALTRELTEHCAPVSIVLTRQMMWRMAEASYPMEAHRLIAAPSRHVASRRTPRRASVRS